MCIQPDLIPFVLHALRSLPTPSTAVCVPLQVPLHIGVAFSTAAQHSWKSPGTNAAMCLLDTLLGTASISGLIKDGAAAGSLAISMRQQLQQAGVLQHLTTVMTALAADLRSGAAALACQSGEELCSQLDRPSVGNINEPQHQASLLMLVRRLLLILRQLWSCPGQTDAATCHSWLCDPSGHAEATMQLCTAALQHISSMLQHVLPAVEERVPQQEAALLQDLQDRTTAALAFSESLERMLSDAAQHTTATLGAEAQQHVQQQLARLLLSPHYLPCVATLVVLNSSWVNVACSQLSASCSQGLAGSSNASLSGCNSSSKGSSKGSSSSKGSGSGSSSTGSSSSSSGVQAVGSDPPIACQLRLFEVLGLDPQLLAMVEQLPSPSQVISRLALGAHLINTYHLTVRYAFCSQGERERETQRQRWRYEQQLWLLLPTVLVPCANNLLLLADGTITDPSQQHVECRVAQSVTLRKVWHVHCFM